MDARTGTATAIFSLTMVTNISKPWATPSWTPLTTVAPTNTVPSRTAPSYPPVPTSHSASGPYAGSATTTTAAETSQANRVTTAMTAAAFAFSVSRYLETNTVPTSPI